MIPLHLFDTGLYIYSDFKTQGPPWSGKNPHEGNKKFRDRKQNRKKSKKKNRR